MQSSNDKDTSKESKETQKKVAQENEIKNSVNVESSQSNKEISAELIDVVDKATVESNTCIENGTLIFTKNYSSVNVYFTNIPLSWNTAQLKYLCKRFGPIVSATIAHHPRHNTSLGYGFVLFVESISAARCVEELSGANASMYGGIRCRFAQDKATPYVVQVKQLKEKRIELLGKNESKDDAQDKEEIYIDGIDAHSNTETSQLLKSYCNSANEVVTLDVNASHCVESEMEYILQHQHQHNINIDSVYNFDNELNHTNWNIYRSAPELYPSYLNTEALLINNSINDNFLSASCESFPLSQSLQSSLQTLLPPPPPPYEINNPKEHNNTTNSFSVLPTHSLERSANNFLNESCPLSSYQQLHYSHSAPLTVMEPQRCLNQTMQEINPSLFQLQQQQEQQEYKSQIMHSAISTTIPTTTKTTTSTSTSSTVAASTLRNEVNEAAAIAPLQNSSFASHTAYSLDHIWNNNLLQNVAASLQHNQEEQPLPMPTAIPTAIIEASALGKSMEELHHVQSRNLLSQTSPSNSSLHPSLSNATSIDVKQILAANVPDVLQTTSLTSEPISFNTAASLVGANASNVSLLMNWYSNNAGLRANDIINNKRADTHAHTQINAPIINSASSMLLHPLGTLVAENTTLNTNVTPHQTNIYDHQCPNVNKEALLNDKYANKSVDNVNGFKYVISQSNNIHRNALQVANDDQSNIHAESGNQFNLSKLQTRNGEAVMWGLPYMLAHMQSNEDNDIIAANKTVPFDFKSESISSAPNALTSSSITTGKLLSNLDVCN